jgi:hypothetical protein
MQNSGASPFVLGHDKGTDVATQRLRPLLTRSNKRKWLSDTGGNDWATKWAQESYGLAKDHAYFGVDQAPVQSDFLFKDFHGNVDLNAGHLRFTGSTPRMILKQLRL